MGARWPVTTLFLPGLLLCLVACAHDDNAPDWSAEIDRAEARWRERVLDDYRIVVSASSLWHMQSHDQHPHRSNLHAP